mmetsp:Transcript_14976/g.47761  ORF Transcript_14976/g.47761 Transcript_14976/m.47761 type:complete len:388 (+) Transcript_14976:172-1335(+)
MSLVRAPPQVIPRGVLLTPLGGTTPKIIPRRRGLLLSATGVGHVTRLPCPRILHPARGLACTPVVIPRHLVVVTVEWPTVHTLGVRMLPLTPLQLVVVPAAAPRATAARVRAHAAPTCCPPTCPSSRGHAHRCIPLLLPASKGLAVRRICRRHRILPRANGRPAPATDGAATAAAYNSAPPTHGVHLRVVIRRVPPRIRILRHEFTTPSRLAVALAAAPQRARPCRGWRPRLSSSCWPTAQRRIPLQLALHLLQHGARRVDAAVVLAHRRGELRVGDGHHATYVVGSGHCIHHVHRSEAKAHSRSRSPKRHLALGHPRQVPGCLRSEESKRASKSCTTEHVPRDPRQDALVLQRRWMLARDGREAVDHACDSLCLFGAILPVQCESK